jgi:2-polyprenyl-6-methoxyphenol hydroxylase-like FAD-dependent oxidoreductase
MSPRQQNNAGKALIVGGGIGGMACAITLRKLGMPVDLIDIDLDWKVYGTGLTITGPTLRAFRDLGLLDAIGKAGYFSRGGRMFLFNGTPLGENIERPVEPGLPSAGGIMRPKLHQIMSEEVRRSSANVRLGLTVDRIDNREDGASATFSDGTADEYTVVIGADGIYSKVRSMISPNAATPSYTGQICWRVVAPRPPEMNFSEFYFGHAVAAGIVPCSETEMYSFILEPQSNPTRVPDDEQPAYVRALLADFGGRMAVLRDGITTGSSIVARPFESAIQPRPWNVGRVVLIGDAAHATTPHLASGAGMAVEDAIVLADEIAGHGEDIPAALATFTERRFERCRFIVETSVSIGERQLAHARPDEIGMLMGKAMHALAQPI